VNYGLAPRPELPPEETAALVVALNEVLRPRLVVAEEDAAPSWRFSGRWFNAGRYALRRPFIN
jgi:hypothetical protein